MVGTMRIKIELIQHYMSLTNPKMVFLDCIKLKF